MRTKTAWIAAVLTAMAVALPAGAEDWTLSLGVTNRSLGDAELKAVSFQSANPAYGPYVNGAFQEGPGVLTVDDLTLQAPGVDVTSGGGPVTRGGGVSLDRFITGNMESGTASDARGVVLGLRRAMGGDSEEIEWGLDLSMVFFQPELRDTLAPTVLTDSFEVDSGGAIPNYWSPAGTNWNYSQNPNGGTFDDLGNPPLNTPSTLPITQTASDQENAGTTTGTLVYDIDMSMLTLGAGFSGVWRVGKLNLSLGAGPTLTIADVDGRVTERAVWTGSGEDVYAPRKHRNNTVQAEVGAYGAVGLTYQITESVGLCVECRYDYVIDDLQTRYADFDLTGASGQLKLVFSF